MQLRYRFAFAVRCERETIIQFHILLLQGLLNSERLIVAVFDYPA